jgi:cell division protein ZapA (FtsZ GTPase activity inhibitor)
MRIRGQEFRIVSEDDEKSLRQVVRYLNETMRTVEKRTGTVDSLHAALLTGLNLARELVRIREERAPQGAGPPPERLRSLTDRVEAVLAQCGDAPAR